jgi:hypothetical protein
MQPTSQAALRVLGSRTQWSRRALAVSIEPAKIAALLPEVFIAECAGLLAFRLRLAGTKICEDFPRSSGASTC